MSPDHGISYTPRATTDEMPTYFPAIQVLLRLQYLRGQTHHWHVRGSMPDHSVHEWPDALAALQGLSIAAHAAGFGAFSGLCLRVAEQFEQMCPEGRISNSAARLFTTWMQDADRYLRRPSSRTLIAAMVSHLGAAQWALPLPAREQDRFIHELLAPFA
jgi:hypothetical protein